MYCSQCGTQNDDDASFCQGCGRVLSVAGQSAGSGRLSLGGLSAWDKVAASGVVAGILLFFLPWVDVYGLGKSSGATGAVQGVMELVARLTSSSGSAQQASSVAEFVLPLAPLLIASAIITALSFVYRNFQGTTRKHRASIAYSISGAASLIAQIYMAFPVLGERGFNPVVEVPLEVGTLLRPRVLLTEWFWLSALAFIAMVIGGLGGVFRRDANKRFS